MAGYTLAGARLRGRLVSFQVRHGTDTVPRLATAHARKLHLYVLSPDLGDVAHVHPRRDAAGTWSVRLPRVPTGRARLVAEFTPQRAAGAVGRAVVLGGDVHAPGTSARRRLPPASSVARVDGYTVRLRGGLLAGSRTQATVSVTDRNDRAAPLRPYLDSWAHALLVQPGTLAVSHLHPVQQWSRGAAAPDAVTFPVHPKRPGRYRLVVEFATGSRVHQVGFTVPAY
ncbi:MAG: hypothetical protein WB441_17145 [Nocardioidaceae bacterium]